MLDKETINRYILCVQNGKHNLITVAAAAELLGMTSQSVRNFIRSGDLPGAIKISPAENSPYVIPEDEVLRLLDRRNKSAK